MIYLDYTAHTPPSIEALAAFYHAETKCIGNANAHHSAGSAASAVLFSALARSAELLHVSEKEIIFTSGASESNNTAIKGIVRAQRQFGKHIITTPLEHPSVSGCLTALQEQGYEIEVLPIGRDGRIELEALEEALREDTVLVTLCALDSELGVVQPVAEASRLIHRFENCRLHVDATQAVGKLDIDLSAADTAAISAHKFGGITGSGALYKKSGVAMEPLVHGGVSTSIYRSGTPAVGLASSFAAALDAAITKLPSRNAYVTELNSLLRREFAARAVDINSPADASPYILNVGVKGVKGAAMRDALNERGVCVSVKSACSVESTPSRAVHAVTRDRRRALESFRISLSHLTEKTELMEFLGIFDSIIAEKRI